MTGYGIDRFTATITVSTPAGYEVIGSGKQSSGSGPEIEAARKGAKGGGLSVPNGYTTRTFTYEDHASFPGTLLIGKYVATKSTEGGLNLTVYTTADHKTLATEYADTATKEFFFYTSSFGPPFSSTLNVVELPNDTVPSAWAPEIAALTSNAFTAKVNYRLLANCIAHQWWGTMLSPATRDDWWLNDGFARYSEAMYVEHVAGRAGFEEVTKDMSVGALAYQSMPLSQVGRLDAFSPEFQSLVSDKGGIILNMLRWVIGDEAFDKTVRDFREPVFGQVRHPRRLEEDRRAEFRPAALLVLHPVARLDRRPGVQEQVHRVSHPEGLPRGRRNPAGPGPVPHAGGVEDRYRRQDRDQAHRGGRHELGVCRRDLRQAAQDHH